VHLETFGAPENQPIVFLHGGPGGDYRSMLPLAEIYDGYSLADDHFLIFWDQRGAGLSERINDPALLTPAVYLEDIEEIISRYAGEKQVVLVGHSWGGAYAAMYMNSHPENIAGAVLFEPMGFSSRVSDDFGFERAGAYTSEWINDWVWGRQFLSQSDHEQADYYLMISFTQVTMPFRYDDFYPQWRIGAAVMQHLDEENLEAKGYDFTGRLSEVDPEVLFMVGEDTEDLGLEYQQTQLGFFQRARLEIIPDAGHYEIICSRASESIAAMRDYFESLPLRDES
jgi:proline iminopeptidase